ncbi:RNA polymerase sigma factor [Fulvivirga sediminis]|uniref:Sigma-70 family RNA polymerase sigma factor n=1 Tax=Fulvivirga sediminis TaxID=2803949 RepID=A0A937K1H1_9BACT|nr:RNA polymerase sigma factor [Fulvivirga sediminis]MBL3657476.1 sigma-70 family RNA polymerase sigma factor [Fulvivirga sediminis]
MENSLRLTYRKNLNEEKLEIDIIEDCKQNPQAFEPLYTKYFEKIYSFIFYRIESANTASELTSQTFLNALSKIHQFTYKGIPFSSWLYRIALNECNAYYRKSKSSRLIILDDKTLDFLSEEVGTDSAYREEHFQKLEATIHTLKPEQVQLLQLRFFDNLSFREIAQILDIKENNAKVKLYRILDKVRLKMDIK